MSEGILQAYFKPDKIESGQELRGFQNNISYAL